MEMKSYKFWRVGFLVLALIDICYATLSPAGINYEGWFFIIVSLLFDAYYFVSKLNYFCSFMSKCFGALQDYLNFLNVLHNDVLFSTHNLFFSLTLFWLTKHVYVMVKKAKFLRLLIVFHLNWSSGSFSGR